MKIRHLTVRNFRGITEQSINFTDVDGKVRPLTVIVGPNRSGKTTLLDALHLVYALLNNAREPELRPHFDPADPRLRPNPNRPIEVEISFSLDVRDEWYALLEVAHALGDVKPPHADVYILKFQWPKPEESTFGVVQQVPEMANLVFRGRAAARVAISRRRTDVGIVERLGGILYLDQRRSIDNLRNVAQYANADQLAQSATVGDILPWMEKQAVLDVRWDPAVKGPSGWTRMCDLFARLAHPTTIDDMEPFPEGFDLRLRDTRTDRTYYLAGTSSGERMMLRIAASLTAFGLRRSAVLIDELELHLHPRWQRNLLHFCKLGADGDTQFIVTTHSDTILRYVEPSAIVSLGSLEQ